MGSECCVYHKHLKGMGLDDGYIGISQCLDTRNEQHHRAAHVANSIYTLYEKMRMHGEDVITVKIFEGTRNECLDYEQELRPNWHMGWNMAIGGGRPGSGWRPGKNWLDNRIWHPEHGEVTISKNMTSTDLANKYLPTKPTGGVQGGLSQLLQGKVPRVYGWELANAQLAQRVRTRYTQPWKVAYLMNGTEVVKLHRHAHSNFQTHYNLKPSTNMTRVINDAQAKLVGWELATQAEWEATTERLEFK